MHKEHTWIGFMNGVLWCKYCGSICEPNGAITKPIFYKEKQATDAVWHELIGTETEEDKEKELVEPIGPRED